VAARPDNLGRLDPARSHGVVNSRIAPTAGFVRDTTMDLSAVIDRKALKGRISPDSDFIDATGFATALIGDSIASNLFMLGFAWQRGLIPLSRAAIERAIELNGVAARSNLRSFGWGRIAAHSAETFERAARPAAYARPSGDPVEQRAADLVEYQDVAYAARYRSLVVIAQEAERRISGETGPFADAVVRNFYKLMAYKDEYEVARLYTDGRFAAKLAQQFEGDFSIEFNLAPPFFSRKDPVTGELRKRAFGSWMMWAFRVLAGMRWLRGTRLDPFGYQAERKSERALIDAYEQEVTALAASLTPHNLSRYVAIAELPDQIRGFGHVKDHNIAAARAEHDRLAGTAPGSSSENADQFNVRDQDVQSQAV